MKETYLEQWVIEAVKSHKLFTCELDNPARDCNKSQFRQYRISYMLDMATIRQLDRLGRVRKTWYMMTY